MLKKRTSSWKLHQDFFGIFSVRGLNRVAKPPARITTGIEAIDGDRIAFPPRRSSISSNLTIDIDGTGGGVNCGNTREAIVTLQPDAQLQESGGLTESPNIFWRKRSSEQRSLRPTSTNFPNVQVLTGCLGDKKIPTVPNRSEPNRVRCRKWA